MASQIPLPKTIRDLIGPLRSTCHPGLLLDKFAESWDAGAAPGKLSERVQRPTLIKVVEASSRCPAGLDWRSLLDRRGAMLVDLRATTWPRTTAGPLTLHLARASALENAGICLHPIYGFAYLPGTGLKGLARAYAETVWLASLPPETQSDGWRTIEKVFGWAPGSDQIAPKTAKPWKPDDPLLKHRSDDAAASGTIVFHDAWPEEWPNLTIDIVNNHHPEYYKGNGPPGDWESPVPVYFLAVLPGLAFRFALGKRADDVPDQLLQQGREWLDGGLTHLGFGAKTAAGYGRFEAPGEDSTTFVEVGRAWKACQEAPRNSAGVPRKQWKDKVILVTPAFLAGAEQSKGDCDLRSPTMRGLLRWWWRTLHAGFLDIDALRSLEASLWGDSKQGGALSISLTSQSHPSPTLFNHRDSRSRFRPEESFKRRHDLGEAPFKTTQGLFYAAFGMDERSQGETKQRYYLDAGRSWEVTMIARAARTSIAASEPKFIPCEGVLAQGVAAIRLLCAFGGVGSRSRKGFGSLQLEDAPAQGKIVTELLDEAAAFRRSLCLDQAFDNRLARSPALARALALDPQIDTPWTDPLTVLDRVGFASQAFAQQMAHRPEKAALGLPRKIHGPNDDEPIKNKQTGVYIQDPENWQPAEWLDFPDRPRNLEKKDARYASPAHFHVSRSPDGRLAIHVLAFPAHNLPDIQSSTNILGDFLEHIRRDVESWAAKVNPSSRPRSRPSSGAIPAAPSTPRGPGKREAQTTVNVKVLGPREKGGYRVQEEGRPEGVITLGPVPSPPPDTGSHHDVWIKDDHPQHPQYEWIDPGKTKKTSPERQRGRGPRRGR